MLSSVKKIFVLKANCSPTRASSRVSDEMVTSRGSDSTYVRVPPVDHYISTSNGATTFHTFQPCTSRSNSDKNSSKYLTLNINSKDNTTLLIFRNFLLHPLPRTYNVTPVALVKPILLGLLCNWLTYRYKKPGVLAFERLFLPSWTLNNATSLFTFQ